MKMDASPFHHQVVCELMKGKVDGCSKSVRSCLRSLKAANLNHNTEHKKRHSGI